MVPVGSWSSEFMKSRGRRAHTVLKDRLAHSPVPHDMANSVVVFQFRFAPHSWEHLTVFEDLFGCHNLEGCCYGHLLGRDCELPYNARSSPPHRDFSNLECCLVQKVRNLRLFPFTSHTFFPQKWVIFWTLLAGSGVDWSEQPQHAESGYACRQHTGLRIGGPEWRTC